MSAPSHPCCDHCDHPDADSEGAWLQVHDEPCPHGCNDPEEP